MLIPIICFTIVCLLGVLAYSKPSRWTFLVSIIAFLPSSCLFYGISDYAIRAGVLTWLGLGIVQRRNFIVKWFDILSLWIVMAGAGLFFTYYHIDMWSPGIIYIFTHTGMSYLYVIVVVSTIPGRIKTEQYLTFFIIVMIIFYAIFGIAQYVKGDYITLPWGGGRFLTESYSYLFSSSSRLVGLFQLSSHETALMLNVGFALLLARMHFVRNTILEKTAISLILIAIVLAQNRGNYLAVATTLMVYMIFIKSDMRFFKVVMPLTIIVSLGIYFSPMLMGRAGIDRLSDPDTAIKRLFIYKTAWKMQNKIVSEKMLGAGFREDLAYGDKETAYFEAMYYGLSENQLLRWIQIFGWPIAVLLVLLILRQVLNLLRYLRRLSSTDDNVWVGWGLFFSWIACFSVLSVNSTSSCIVPLLFALTGIWMQEIKQKSQYHRHSRWLGD